MTNKPRTVNFTVLDDATLERLYIAIVKERGARAHHARRKAELGALFEAASAYSVVVAESAASVDTMEAQG